MNIMKNTLLVITASFIVALATPEALATAPANEAYEKAREALDHGNYPEARELFSDIIRDGGPRTEEALYWKAYAETKMASKRTALRSLKELERLFPNSKWLDDAAALKMEIRRGDNGGELPEDEELKLYALQALVVSDPDRAVPIIQRYLKEGKSDQLKERALFLLLQADTAESRDIVADTALAGSSQILRFSAIRTLGMIGDKEAMDVLERTYRETDDVDTRNMIISSFMMARDAERLKAVLNETENLSNRRQAIQMLGVMHATDYLKELYGKEENAGLRRAIVQSVAISGDGDFIMRVIREEKDPEIRSAALQSLMMVDVEGVGKELVDIYEKTERRNEKHVILQALAMEGEADLMIDLFNRETDKEMRRVILQNMAMFMDEEKTSEFFLDILEEK